MCVAHISQTETQRFPNEPLAIAYNVDIPNTIEQHSTCLSIKLMLMVLKCACVPLYLLAADLLSIASIVPSLFVFNLQEIKRWKERQTVSQSKKNFFIWFAMIRSFISVVRHHHFHFKPRSPHAHKYTFSILLAMYVVRYYFVLFMAMTIFTLIAFFSLSIAIHRSIGVCCCCRLTCDQFL